MSYKEMYINFSIDFGGTCEYVDDFTVDGVDRTDDISEDEVDDLIMVLEKMEGFMVSDDRTEVRVWWSKDGTTRVSFDYYNEPEDGEFDTYELTGIPYIEFNPTFGEDDDED